MKKIFLFFTVSFLYLTINGCGGAQIMNKTAPTKADIDAKRFIPNKGFANLYVFTDTGTLPAGLFLDGKMIGEIRDDSYFNIPLKPGKHKLYFPSRYDSKIPAKKNNSKAILFVNIDAKEGRNYYIDADMHSGFPPYVTLTEVPEHEGKDGVNECELLIHNKL
jgi:hypothetical protein